MASLCLTAQGRIVTLPGNTPEDPELRNPSYATCMVVVCALVVGLHCMYRQFQQPNRGYSNVAYVLTSIRATHAGILLTQGRLGNQR